jgi:hypothetical protein
MPLYRAVGREGSRAAGTAGKSKLQGYETAYCDTKVSYSRVQDKSNLTVGEVVMAWQYCETAAALADHRTIGPAWCDNGRPAESQDGSVRRLLKEPFQLCHS